VLAKEGHSYKVELPASIKINPVFPVESLCHNLNDSLPSQANAPPPPIRVTVDNEYKVQEIIAVKLTRGKLAYRAKWTSADEDLKFYSASDFKYSPHLLKRFHLANLTLPGPPANLPLWLQAWEDRVDDYDHLDSDKPALARSRTSFFGGGGWCDKPGFSLRPAMLTSREAWRSAVYISSRALFTSSLLSLVFFNILRCISEL
jgi:hypothetical protein